MLDDLMPKAIPPHRQSAGFALNIIIPAYNPNLIAKADLPKSYADFLDPKWKGKLGIEADDSDWFGGLVTQLGEDKGIALFRDIAAKTGTAQLGTDPPTSHTWVIAWAGPPGEPQVAVAVVVERQPGASEATGGRIAAPIAKVVIDKVLEVRKAGG